MIILYILLYFLIGIILSFITYNKKCYSIIDYCFGITTVTILFWPMCLFFLLMIGTGEGLMRVFNTSENNLNKLYEKIYTRKK